VVQASVQPSRRGAIASVSARRGRGGRSSRRCRRCRLAELHALDRRVVIHPLAEPFAAARARVDLETRYDDSAESFRLDEVSASP